MKVHNRIAAALALAAFAAVGAAAAPHPFTAQDLVTLERVSDPQLSPDGHWLAYVLRTTDLAADRGRTDLWRVAADGASAPERLTTDPANDSNPRWAPDGRRIYFLSERSGSSQLWALPVDGGEARPVTELPLDVGSFAVAPDGRHLAVSLEVFVDCPDLDCTVGRLKEREESPAEGQVYEHLFVRHWDSWKDGRRSHLYVVPVAGEGAPVDVSRGLDADVPSKPFGDASEYAFTPDSTGVVFTARVAGAGEPWSTNFDLYLAAIDGSAAPRRLTDNPAWDTGPVFSPDGKTLAYRAMRRAGFEADRFRIVLQPWPGGAPRVLTEAWDRSPEEVVFAADGRTLYATAADRGEVALFAIDAASGAARRVVGGGHVRFPAVGGGRLFFGRDDFRSPVELFSLPAAGGEAVALTAHNATALAEIARGDYEQFSFPGWHGETVYGYLVKPVGFDPARHYPLAFLIHGGPQGSFANDFHYRWNPQIYAGAGYAAVLIDFHGSTGYGQAFTDSISGDWGGKPFEDLKKGLDYVLATYPWIDGERRCALGASYGGYMINWIAGNWPDGFVCLVNHDGVFNTRSMYYSTEELWFPEWEFGGTPWASPESYERFNPVRFVDRWKTPMLVVHGAFDYRVPDTQGLGAFTALQRRGIPSKLLYFPHESHFVLKPHDSLQWHEEVLGWLARWIGEK